MKVVLLLLLVGGSFCFNVPPRNRASDACFPSPCGKNASCKSVNGLTQCYCAEGLKGDPFIECSSSVNGEPNTNSKSMIENSHTHTSNPGVKTVQDMELVQAKQPVGFTVEYQTSTDTVSDSSRIPILGGSTQATPQTQHPHQINAHRHVVTQPMPSVVHETVVHSHINRHTPQHFQTPNVPIENQDPYKKHGLISSLDAIVNDPMGQYSNCRTINGVVVCADNSVDDTPFSGPVRPASSNYHPSQTPSGKFPSRNNSQQMMTPTKPQTSSGDCKSMCGINSVCRMINNRQPVCGCPVGFTGDPGVRCDPYEKEEEKSGCQKHTECTSTEVCIDSKCVNPCTSGTSGQINDQNTSGRMCGSNAKCLVIQHTPLCGCENEFFGNPYVGCV